MGYISLYRKWRPQSFKDVVGQDHVVQTLVNSLQSGRLAHAYLFAGPRGTGKTTVARLLAKGLNCRSGPTATPCGSCSECAAIGEGSSLNVVEIDGASNRGIDDVRELRGQVRFTPINAGYKVYIIDEVHMLTPEAFNALLKTLEEPPAHVVFIFATTDPHRLPPTILSRVQRFDFQRFREKSIVSRLKTVAEGEKLQVDGAALELIAGHAEGSMRDAIGILEKCAAYADKITESSAAEVLGVAPQEQISTFISHLLAGGKIEALQLVNQLYNEGKDLAQFARSVLTALRREIVQDPQGTAETKKLRAIQILAETLREMRFAVDPRIPLEVAVLEISCAAGADQGAFIQDLEDKLLSLEAQIAGLSAQLEAGAAQKAAEPGAAPDLRPLSKPVKNESRLSAYILENWEEYLQNLRKERLMQCEAFLREGTPQGVKNDVLVVAFPKDRGFHKASMEQDNHREPAERVLSKFLGASFRLDCVFLEEDPVSAGEREEAAALDEEEGSGAPQAELDPREKEFIEASERIFGGKVFLRPKQE